MALQVDPIEDRIEGLKSDELRMMFDSKVRAFRRQQEAPKVVEGRSTKPGRRTEDGHQIDQVVSLLEELARRLDGIDRKARSLAEENRKREHRDRSRRAIATAIGLAILGVMALGRMLLWS